MRIHSMKLWVDTEIHPDEITDDHLASIQSLPDFDEFDIWDETFKVAFYLKDPSQNPMPALAQTLGVLI